MLFEIVGLHDNYLYYFREEGKLGSQATTGEGFDLCRINLENNKSEHIFSLNNEWFLKCKDYIDIIGSSIYFYDYHDTNLETGECVDIIYRLDTDTAEVSVFRDDAENVIPYKNGVIYYHDGGYYYHGESEDIKGKGIFYEGDELIFYANINGEREIAQISSEKDTLIYSYYTYDSTGSVNGNVIGFFDDDFNRIDIAATEAGTWFFDVSECTVSEMGLIAICGASSPMIYDMKNDCFTAIFAEDNYSYSCYSADVTEDSISFFAYEKNSYGDYTSLAYYIVRRK